MPYRNTFPPMLAIQPHGLGNTPASAFYHPDHQQLALPMGASDELCSLCTDGPVEATDLIVDVKADGVRALWLGGLHGEIVSREGTRLHFAKRFLIGLSSLEASFGRQMFIEGEITHPDGLDACLDAMKARRPDPLLTFWAFDAVPYEVWAVNGRSAPLAARRALLSHAMRWIERPGIGMLIGQPVPALPLVAGQGGRNTVRRDLDAIAEAAWSLGYEGVVVKDATAPYSRGRGDWVRVKEVETADVLVRDINGSRCSVKVETREGKDFNLTVPRREFADIADMMIRQPVILEVRHRGTTRGGVPRQATFARIRHDRVAL